MNMYYVSDYKLTDNLPFSFILEAIVEATEQDGTPKKRNNYQVYKIRGEMTTSMPDVSVGEIINKQFVDKTGLISGDKFQLTSSTGSLTKEILTCKIGSEVTLTKVGNYEYTVTSGEGLGDLVKSVQVDENKVEEIVKERVEEKTTQDAKDDQFQRSVTMKYVAMVASSRAQMTDQDMVECAEYLNNWIVNGKEGNKGGVPF